MADCPFSQIRKNSLKGCTTSCGSTLDSLRFSHGVIFIPPFLTEFALKLKEELVYHIG